MRRVLVISGLAARCCVIPVAAVIAYAVYNVTALIGSNQQRILNRVSNALDRPVQVGEIKKQVGWGLEIQVDNLKIADNPVSRRIPFLTAEQVGRWTSSLCRFCTAS